MTVCEKVCCIYCGITMLMSSNTGKVSGKQRFDATGDVEKYF